MIAAPASHGERFPYSLAAVAIAAAGTLAAGMTVWAVASSSLLAHATAAGWLRGLLVWSYTAVGAYTWWRRSESRLGLMVAGAGFLYAFTSLSAASERVPFTVGRLLLALFVVYLVYVFLCFPRDRLHSTLERRFIKALALLTGVSWAAALALAEKLPAGGPWTDCGDRCPDNAFALTSTSETTADILGFVVGTLTAVALAGAAILLLRKAHSPSLLRRRAIAPLFYAVATLAASYSAFTLLRQADVGGLEALRLVAAASALGIPTAILIGQIQGRVFAATSLGQLVASVSGAPVTPPRVEALVRDALGDPTLALLLWDAERSGYVDVRGDPVELPSAPAERTVTPLVRDGRPVAALAHDPSLDEGPVVLEGLAATALMLLENTRLVEELRASRSRIVSAGDEARLRLERDLHDGAQQRLMNIQIRLAEARGRAEGVELARELEAIGEEAQATVAELRHLAQGIYPTVLRERGLGDGLRALAETAPVHVSVRDHSGERCVPTVEAAVYFCASEAIQNTIKHAGPGADVTVTLVRRGDELEFDVTDDGPGFDPGTKSAGVGLVSMRDRIGAVGGEVEIASSPGHGTSVRGWVPVATY